jgi:uroporphyrinogen decarboxylase
MADRLTDIIRNHGRPLVIPLMGFPGVQLNGSTLKQNTFNWGTQFSTVFALQRRFRPDGIFFFMDLSVEASALGLPVRFPLDESPSVESHLVRSAADLERFSRVDVLADGRVMVYVETMRLMSRYIDALKGAYVIGPFSLAGLLMGATEAAMATVMEPDLLHQVLRFCSGVISRYARELERAGADTVAILEPSASFLSPRQFREFAGQYLVEIIETLSCVPILHICGQTVNLVDAMVETGAQGLSLDSMVDLPEVAKRVPADVAVIGNLDTVRVMIELTPNQVYRTTQGLLEAMAPYPNFILSTACDLPAETPLENIHALMDAGQGRPPGRPYNGV